MKYQRSILPFIFLFGLGIAESSGQQSAPPFQVKESRNSNIRFYTTNYGIFGLNVASAESGFIVPRESDKKYLFGSGIWFGAKKQVSHDGGITFEEEKLSFICYNPNSAQSWALPGEYRAASSTANPVLYHSIDYNRFTGAPNNAGSPDPNWPLWLLPGERTDPLNAGTFVPLDEERMPGGTYSEPAFMNGVHEEFFSRYHDGDLTRYEIGGGQASELGYPLGLQVQEHIYSWEGGDPRQNVVILQYEVTNVSNDVLRDCHIAQATDFDIGDPMNDRMQFYALRPELHTGIAWTESEATEYGLLAMVVLEGPVVDANGFIDGSRRAIFSEGEAGTFRNWTSQIDPGTSEERYDFLAENLLDGDDGPGDKRALMGSGAFHMAPGDKAYFTFAFAVLEGVTVNGTHGEKGTSLMGAAIPELEALVEELQVQYYETGFGAQTTSVTGDRQGDGGFGLAATMSPNPGNESTTLRLALADRFDVRIRIVDNLGRTVRQEEIANVAAGSFTHELDLRELEAGSYLVSIQTGAKQQSLRLNVVR